MTIKAELSNGVYIKGALAYVNEDNHSSFWIRFDGMYEIHLISWDKIKLRFFFN